MLAMIASDGLPPSPRHAEKSHTRPSSSRAVDSKSPRTAFLISRSEDEEESKYQQSITARVNEGARLTLPSKGLAATSQRPSPVNNHSARFTSLTTAQRP